MRPLISLMILTLVLLGVPACAGHDHPDEGDRAHEAGSNDERATIAVTSWTERSELFMEHPVLVAGEAGRFAIHVTDLSDFSPLTSGEATVVLREDNGSEQSFTGGISRPGIFGADVTPPEAGSFEMSLRVEAPGVSDLHELGPVTVHSLDAVPSPEDEEEDGGITFLKEQQWTLEFGTEPVTLRTLRSSRVVPGTVSPRPGGESVLSAPVSGRLDPALIAPVPGGRVTSGRPLTRILPTTDDLMDEAGLRAAHVEAVQRHELARQERDRAARLVEARALPARRLSEAEASFESTRARLQAAAQRLKLLAHQNQTSNQSPGSGWFAIRSPLDGIVAEVHFTAGQSVAEGDLLLRLVDASKVHLVGRVPESAAADLGAVFGAELLLGGASPVPLGPAVSVGRVVDPGSRTLEVRYAMDNRELRLPVDRAIQMRLFLGEPMEGPAARESAVVDDGGRPVVFVHASGESFERRPVTLGSREGGYVHLLQGVAPGERVVTRGAFLIRLASMSSQVPAHGHVH